MIRVAHKSIFDAYRFRLGRITDELQTATMKVSSGKRINSFQDDPVGITQVLKLKSNLSNLDQLKRNITTGRSWLTAGETALTQTQEILSDAIGVCVQYKSATVTAAQRIDAAQIVLGQLLNIVQLANTTVNGQYIFAGTKTDTAPFSLDNDSDPTTADYYGNTDAFAIKTGKDTTVEVGHNGKAVFGDIMSALIDLIGYLKSNDTDGIGTVLTQLDTELDDVLSEIAEIGGKEIRLDTREKVITDLNLRYTENRSDIEDIDIVEAVSDLKSTELAYQAALASSSKIMNLSLVDFL
ncbi:MAG: flagellar hook-associated protein FlgL [Deltaproteobacteria bacterium]|nr:flagellar hook-associated protein FlgL [Deltaproteobacteria bacterium]